MMLEITGISTSSKCTSVHIVAVTSTASASKCKRNRHIFCPVVMAARLARFASRPARRSSCFCNFFCFARLTSISGSLAVEACPLPEQWEQRPLSTSGSPDLLHSFAIRPSISSNSKMRYLRVAYFILHTNLRIHLSPKYETYFAMVSLLPTTEAGLIMASYAVWNCDYIATLSIIPPTIPIIALYYSKLRDSYIPSILAEKRNISDIIQPMTDLVK